jgi:hypothetical protein
LEGTEASQWNCRDEGSQAAECARFSALRLLHVEFDDEVSGTIDLSGELDGEVFQPLRDEAIFRQVTVDEFGAVCWPNGPDLTPDTMHSELTGEPTPQSRPQRENTVRSAGAKPRAGR